MTRDIDLKNPIECEKYGIIDGNSISDLGYIIRYYDMWKYPVFAIFDGELNMKIYVENVDGLESWMITDCKLHHNSICSEYVSLDSPGKFRTYNGRFGSGYTINRGRLIYYYTR